MSDMMKMLEKKKKSSKELDPMYKDSKMSVLQQLRDQMAGLMKDDLDPSKMKKVEVAASDEEGLKHGLDKAKDILSGDHEDPSMETEESPEEEKSESPEEKAEEMAQDASDEDLDAMIKKLEEMKQKKSMMV